MHLLELLGLTHSMILLMLTANTRDINGITTINSLYARKKNKALENTINPNTIIARKQYIKSFGIITLFATVLVNTTIVPIRQTTLTKLFGI